MELLSIAAQARAQRNLEAPPPKRRKLAAAAELDDDAALMHMDATDDVGAANAMDSPPGAPAPDSPPPARTLRQLFGNTASKYRQCSKEAAQRMLFEYIRNSNDPAARYLLAFATQFKWSEQELHCLLHGFLPLYSSFPHPICSNLSASKAKPRLFNLLESVQEGDGPQLHESTLIPMSHRSGKKDQVPTWRLLPQIEQFFQSQADSHWLLSDSAYDGINFHHFVSGECFNTICSACADDEVPVCLELSYDHAGVTKKSSLGSIYLGICNLHDEVKGQSRFVAFWAKFFFFFVFTF